MNTPNRYFLILASLATLSLNFGCTPLIQLDSEGKPSTANQVELNQGNAPRLKKDQSYAHLYVGGYDSSAMQNARMAGMAIPGYKAETSVTVNHYVQSLMHDLAANLEVLSTTFSVGVTSFVYLDGDYQQGDLLGNQLSEAFMHEATQFGMAVTDFKTTDYIRVTPTGDFTFSRDFLELTQQYPISVVLGGTLVRHHGGVIVNARMVNVNDKKVLASAQAFIPQQVVQSLKGSHSAPLLQLKAAGAQ
ncbi:FlgO family outer membrane protein [Rheinheimera soli]|uniref:TolB-like protein n=1 Tax=Rheinheimera soli TaxID=443616 RepID=A0ABU1VTW9_9GAMM|nr:FlgO family outer membrane protein [Rheinheimera soli]MDR7119161.1 TolB-like protein [Rheinheimera soli]